MFETQGDLLPNQRKRPFSEAVNVSGAKRHYPDRPPSPRCKSKWDLASRETISKPQDMSHCDASSSRTSLLSPLSERPASNIEAGEPNQVQRQIRAAGLPESSPIQESSPVFSPSTKIYWKERFLMLQKFLNQCDQSDQEEYIQTLRSASAAVRSKHAVDLEKRAIHLLLEEGKELSRMKMLNILGTPSSE
ncbi:uncharacterized protein LOC144716986 [Wolffia australiana]